MILIEEGIEYYYLYDIDSGYPYRVTKEYYEWYNKQIKEVFNNIRSSLNIPYKGTLIVGTADDFESGNIEELFYNPDKYDLKTFPNVWDDKPNTKLQTYFKPAYMPREFKQPEPLKDSDPMPFGKHKGIIMEKVPAKYLLYMYENSEDLHLGVKQYIEANLEVIKQQAKNE